MIEAQSAARITHPNVVTVYDILSEDGKPWLVMQLVHGQTLEQQLGAGPLAIGQTVTVGLAVVEALAAAHALGIVHRDVKPANVLIADDGKILLTDFSIAKVIGRPGITRDSDTWGTPGYMAPELVKNWLPGPLSDLFGLGVLLFRAVEGYGPFDRDDPHAMLIASVTERHPRPVRAGPLTLVIDGLLEKDPMMRWTTVATRGALQAIARGQPPAASSRPVAQVPLVGPLSGRMSPPEPVSDRMPSDFMSGPVPPPGSVIPPRPPRKPGVRTVSVAVTATLALTITLALTLMPGSDGSSTTIGSASSTPNITITAPAANSPSTAQSSGASAAPPESAPAVITGSWGQVNGPLTLVVSEVDVKGGMLQLHMKATDASSSAIDFPLFDNCVAVDNTGATYDADSTSPWTEDVPPGQSVTGIIDFGGTLTAGATKINVSFSVVYGLVPPIGGDYH